MSEEVLLGRPCGMCGGRGGVHTPRCSLYSPPVTAAPGPQQPDEVCAWEGCGHPASAHDFLDDRGACCLMKPGGLEYADGCMGFRPAAPCAQPDEVDRVTYGSLRGRPRVMGVCPSCGVANLALSEGLPYVVCGNLRCTDPTAPSNALGRTPAAPSAQPDEKPVHDCGYPNCREKGDDCEPDEFPCEWCYGNTEHDGGCPFDRAAQPVRDTEEDCPRCQGTGCEEDDDRYDERSYPCQQCGGSGEKGR